ncbi:MAG: HPr family phosphocarrier protein [Gammaproteobacteria bacterium]|jgi:phosphocarrier protein
MISKDVTIINKLGLHARAAARFVSLASSFESDVRVSKEGKTVNGKSIMGVMMLAASQNTTITIAVEGEDETDAINQLIALINDRFGETE